MSFCSIRHACRFEAVLWVSFAGWVAGPIVLFMFAWITYFCSALLIDAYRYPDVDSTKRNYTYIQAVKRYLGESALQSYLCNFLLLACPDMHVSSTKKLLTIRSSQNVLYCM